MSKKKVLIAGGVGILALAGSIAFAGPAMADTAPPVTYPIEVHADWYAPSPATVANAFAVPQHLSPVLTCGGVHQSDYYTIDSADAQVAYNALLATNTLNSSAEDAPFHPHNYTVTALPACLTPSPVILDVLTLAPTCQAGTTYQVPTQPTGIKYALSDPTDPGSDRPHTGTFPTRVGETTTIVAHSIDGYVPVSKTWTIVGLPPLSAQSTDANAPCYVAPASNPVNPGNPTKAVAKATPPASATLAYTGGTDVTTAFIPWGIAFLLLGAGFVILKRRHDRMRA